MGRPRKPRCVIDGCDDIAVYKKAQLCHRCYNRIAWQLKQGVSWAVRRARRLQSWQSGLEVVLGNVSTIESKQDRRRRRA